MYLPIIITVIVIFELYYYNVKLNKKYVKKWHARIQVKKKTANNWTSIFMFT